MNNQEKKEFEEFKEFKAQQGKPKKKKKKLLTILLSIFVLIIVISACNAITGGGSDKNSSKKEDAKVSHKMNENVKVDKLEFNVTNKATADQVGSVITNKAKGTFIVLDVTVKNNGNEAVDITDSFFKLVGDGKTYEADSAASTSANQAVSPDDLGFLGDKINPDSTKTGKIVFDVSQNVANKKDLVLQVQSGVFGTKTEKIKLQ